MAGGNSAFCDVYDPGEDRWEHLPALPETRQPGAPTGRGGLAAAIAGGYLYAFGGEWFDGDGGVYRDVFALDLAELRWHEAGRMPRPRRIGTRKLWHLSELIEAFAALPADGPSPESNPFSRQIMAN